MSVMETTRRAPGGTLTDFFSVEGPSRSVTLEENGYEDVFFSLSAKRIEDKLTDTSERIEALMLSLKEEVLAEYDSEDELEFAQIAIYIGEKIATNLVREYPSYVGLSADLGCYMRWEKLGNTLQMVAFHDNHIQFSVISAKENNKLQGIWDVRANPVNHDEPEIITTVQILEYLNTFYHQSWTM